MSSTDGEDARGPRPPGWYPDPRDPTRHRHWDGSQWSELSATTPFPTDGPTTGPASGPGSAAAAAVAPATGPDRRVLLAIVGGAAAILVLALGAWVLLGGDDATDRSDDAAARSSTTSDPGGAAEPGATVTTGPATTATDGAGAATTVPDPGPTTTGDDGAAPCEVEASQLLEPLRAYPPLASLAAGLTVEDPRCVDSWATAVVSAPDTDRALAVFQREGSAWSVVLVGSAEPCAGLGIPPEAAPALGCGDW